MICLRVSIRDLTRKQVAELFDDAQALLECWDDHGHRGNDIDKAEMLEQRLRDHGWAVDELDELAFRIVTDGMGAERSQWLP
jgi:hypothetical protein